MRVQPSFLTACVAAIAVAAAIAGPIAIAEDPSTGERLDAARSEADRLADRVGEREAALATLDQRAREAGARAMQLAAQVRAAADRSAALDDDLRAAERELDSVESRLGRAVGVLSDRLVEIYKAGGADELSVILGSEDMTDLQARSEYLAALNESDEAITDRVRSLREEIAEGYEQIAGLKERIDDEAGRLDAARAEAADARAAAEKRAAELTELLGGERSELAEVRERVSELESELAAEQAPEPSAPAYSGGPYAIPTYIVMCESGGDYSAYNPSSGAGGAYQIIPSTWAAYGGKGQSHTAPKAEQDRIAALIWADVGPSAWSCA